MKTRKFCAGLIGGLLVGGAAVPIAWSAERSVEPERCLQLSRVRSTEVLSKRQTAFQTGGKEYYLNTLPYPCPGLRGGTSIMFRTSIDRVCNVDVVTVLEPFGGGFFPGASCGLGLFEPIDEDELTSLREAARAD